MSFLSWNKKTYLHFSWCSLQRLGLSLMTYLLIYCLRMKAQVKHIRWKEHLETSPEVRLQHLAGGSYFKPSKNRTMKDKSVTPGGISLVKILIGMIHQSIFPLHCETGDSQIWSSKFSEDKFHPCSNSSPKRNGHFFDILTTRLTDNCFTPDCQLQCPPGLMQQRKYNSVTESSGINLLTVYVYPY